jgi:CubicO group peptidase (beta-lactamase class C family)
MASVLVHVVVLLSIHGARASQAEDSLEASLQQIIDQATLLSRGTGLSLGVALPTRTISLSSGKHRMGIGAEGSGDVAPTDPFAMGSTTKMYTAAAVLRLVDAGEIGLDDKATPLFDALWTKLNNGKSITESLGPQIKEVTVRHLLNMQSGIPDFDNGLTRTYQFGHPQEDLGPVKELSFLKKGQRFVCSPGTCASYSSSNYELLGLILAQQAGAQSWDDYKQAAGLPEDVLAQMPNTKFAVHGLCSEYTKVHGYSGEKFPPVDVSDVSCTNGWTCGNVVSNAGDAAVFVRALLGQGERVVKTATQQEMLKMSPLTQGWMVGLPYGLGLMDISHMMRLEPRTLVGHGGETYGFNAQTGYSKEHDFGLSVVANTESVFLIERVAPKVYQAVKTFMSSSKAQTMMV